MKHCENCGANLKFDIASQKMLCEHCGSTEEPEHVEAEEAKAADVFDTMIYQCTNCMGEVVADENEAAVFCPYCGDTTILHGRIAKVSRPQYIIPFQKTKSECIDSYKALLKKSIYAPNKLRNEGVTSAFRGIYMPYWSYDQKQDVDLRLKGETVKVNVLSEDVDTYHCIYNVDATYNGMTFDASKVFDDTLSLAIAPFDVEGKRDFSPGYISGFYADTYDVEGDIYEEKASMISTKTVLSEIRKNKDYRFYNIGKLNPPTVVKSVLASKTVEKEVGYHPVWFMATRFGQRMAYATINGQTGKAAAIIPASPWKFLLFSLLTALPLFFLLNQVSFLTPEFAVMFVNILALFVYLVYDRELSVLQFKEAAQGIQQLEKGEEVKAQNTKVHQVIRIIWSCCLAVAIISYGKAMLIHYGTEATIPVNLITTISLWVVMFGSILRTRKLHDLMKGRFLFIGIPIVATISVAMQLKGIPLDIYYYVVSLAQLAAIAIVFIDLIYYHNVIATKPMPLFERTGGDDNVH
ncbi:MAG: hypothetical protein Q4D51_10055 [Eubacteriales bacterium]|nr:hypothetical protein [Eubacteriales bacterium]